MTGKEMIKIIQDNGLEDFKLKIITKKMNETVWGFNYETFHIDSMADIGHSDRTVTFDTIEK